MAFFARLFLGNGKLKPGLRADLESEGLVIIEEGLRGSVHYRRFKAPGRRFHGKVTLERIALAISEHRLAMYCRSGRVELIDSAFSNPWMSAIDVSLDNYNTVSIRIDYDRVETPNVSGEIRIRVRTPKAASIVEHLLGRLGPRASDS